MTGPVSDVMAEILAGCPHREVLPLLPAHIERDAMWSTVEGRCSECGEGPFLIWEAYGYGDAHAGTAYPTRNQVLLDFDAWWQSLREAPTT